ncbi:MAG: M15 family metallopeptidase [Nitrospirae bacterium]|nr:M15 family metallopeptidase [Nitrospirota bacterium]
MPSRKIEDLNLVVREKCRQFISLCKEKGIDVIITSTLRTEAEQLALFSQGRKTLKAVNELRKSAGLPPITEKENKRKVTGLLTSTHQFGCAFDCAIGGQKGITYDIKADINKNHIPDYEEIGRIGESIGLRWGGRFKFKDYVHFEYTGGITLSELKAGKRPEEV